MTKKNKQNLEGTIVPTEIQNSSLQTKIILDLVRTNPKNKEERNKIL